MAVTEIADQEIAAEGPEGVRRDRQPPRRVQLSVASDARKQLAVRSNSST